MDQDTESGLDRYESQSYRPIPKRFEGWNNGKETKKKMYSVKRFAEQ